MSTKWKVYKLESPNGRAYIGCTKLPLEKRWENGYGYKNNPELFDDIVEYGWVNFNAYQLFESENELEARDREHLEIKKYPDGYNRYRGVKPRTTGNGKTPPKQIICLNTGKIYDSIHEAAQQTGLPRVKISECCSGKRQTVKGTTWKYYKDND